MIGRMTAAVSLHEAMAGAARRSVHWLASWWRVIHLGALLLVLAATPASYGREGRAALARLIVRGTAPALAGFSVLATLISVVLIRIVVVTASSYGLSQYALEMVVRVLVLELIPLTAALYAALRCTIPFAAELAPLKHAEGWSVWGGERWAPLARHVLPRVAAGVFCALMLAAVSCVVALVVAYLSVYGFAAAGFDAYTHTVGRVFGPGLSLIFGLKILGFGLAVALMPAASVLEEGRAWTWGSSAELHGLVRMFLVILLIEGFSLVGNYY